MKLDMYMNQTHLVYILKGNLLILLRTEIMREKYKHRNIIGKKIN